MELVEKLKRCPLCGDKDEFNPSVGTSYKYAFPGTGNTTDLVEAGHYVECDKCGCCGPIEPTEDECVAKWNTRPAMPTNELIEAEREALERALRIGIWNRLRDSGVDQDTAIAEVNRTVEGVKTEARAALSKHLGRP